MILKDLCSNMGMTVNTNKTKVMIIKSKKVACMLVLYMKIATCRKCLLTNILELIFITNLTRTIVLRKGLMKGGNLIFCLENKCKLENLVPRHKNKFLFETLSLSLSYIYNCEVCGCSREP